MSDPQVIAQLEIARANGDRQIVATDDTWRTTLGPTTVSSWYGGEDYDARREAAGLGPARVRRPRDLATGRAGQRPSAHRRGSPRRSGSSSSPARQQIGQNVFDLGRNIAGFPEITVTAPAGTTIRVYPAESLFNGHANQSISNVGAPLWDQFTSAGGTRTWHPEFTYHGFRYLEVVGLPAGATVTVRPACARWATTVPPAPSTPPTTCSTASTS